MTTELHPSQVLASFYRRARLAHAQNPDQPDKALCGFPIKHTAPVSPESTRCVVCEDLTRRDWSAR